MRRLSILPLVLFAALCWLVLPPRAQAAGAAAGAGAAGEPPHAWLFGTWTGGLFPAAAHPSAEACLAQPVVIFTKDVVLRASLIDPTYAQRVIETVRVSPQGADFRFTPAATPPGGVAGMLAQAATPPQGFGCADPDALQVRRLGPNKISFPGCTDFPNPLVRCP